MPMRREVRRGGLFGRGSLRMSCSRAMELGTILQWSWAQYYKCKCAPCLSASPRRDMRSSILLPACLIGLVADRVTLAPSFGEYDLVSAKLPSRAAHRERQ